MLSKHFKRFCGAFLALALTVTDVTAGSLTMLRVGAQSDSIPVFVSKGTGNRSGTAGSFTVTAPTSITNGNTLYLAVWQVGTTNAATCTGFSQIYYDNSAQPTLTILKKTASGESGNYTVGATSSTQALAVMLNYSGGSGTQDVVGTIARSTSSATITASSITATVSGVLLAFYATNSAASTVSTPPSGMTQRDFLSNVTGGNTMATYELSPSPSGSTGTHSLVWSASNTNGGILMQIK